MKVLVDEMPRKPGDCLYSRWNANIIRDEYGWVCWFKENKGFRECHCDVGKCPFLMMGGLFGQEVS